MKLFVRLAAILALFVPSLAFGASVATVTGLPFASSYDWPAVNSAGALSTYLYVVGKNGAPVGFTVDAVTSGTLPSSCSFEVESSPDGINWNAGTNSLSGTLSCAAAGTLTTSFAFKPVRYIRINVTSYAGGDGTTAINFYYTRGVAQ